MQANDSFARRVRLKHRYRRDSAGLLMSPLGHATGAGPLGRRGDLDTLVAELADGGADAVVLHKAHAVAIPTERGADLVKTALPNSAVACRSWLAGAELPFQPGPLQHADPVLAGDRSAEPQRGVGTDARTEGQRRLARFLSAAAGETVHTVTEQKGIGGPKVGTKLTVTPHSPGLRERIWYGSGSVASAVNAARQSLRLITGTILHDVPAGVTFPEHQARVIAAYREAWTAGRGRRVDPARHDRRTARRVRRL